MIGTITNTATVIAGSLLGLLIHSRMPRKISGIVFHAIGLFTLVLGFTMAFKSDRYLIMIFSLVLGAIVGELLDIDAVLNSLSDRLKKRLKISHAGFTEGLITAFFLFCMGSMTILGAFEEGLGGEPTLLMTKAVLDGFSSIALAASLGVGVLFSALPLFLFQGGLTLFASWLHELFTPEMIAALSAVGGVLLVGLGLSILEIKKIKIANLLPSLIFITLLAYIFP
jgi:hypothetical protein